MHPPSVDSLARSLADTGLPHPLLVDLARSTIADGAHEQARERAEELQRTLLQPVINGTGVLLHTNLGRAPMAHDHAESYANLEFDLLTGKRGSRQRHVGALFARAVGAESAIVVNNGAAAMLLVLGALAAGEGVAVSRGELVEIGGGFRVPEVMTQSGARLVEVGTTNRTRAADFEAVAGDVTLLLQVHQSNYRIEGFTEAPTTAQLAQIGPPVIADIGSGLLDAACPWLDGSPPAWLADEPAARQTLEAGAALVIFSGDKLLGGPQAGIIAGDAELVARCAKHPLARAVRPGGLVLAALQDLALRYLERDGQAVPFWRMATIGVDTLRARAEAMGVGAPTELASTPGGGTLPGVEIPSYGIALDGDHTAALRDHEPPIIARVVDNTTLVDLRTVSPDDDPVVAAALAGCG
jgi:L-seryl-tRNA(Ser) seleniumtransferase